jgi:hypothetical protein
MKKCCHFIYLIKDELMDKVLKQSHDSQARQEHPKHDAS